MKPHVRIAIACALAAIAPAGLPAGSAIATAKGQPSVLVRMSSSEPMAAIARETDPQFYFVQPEDHYDGSYFYAIARDPFATGPEHKLIDQAAYRYSHGGYGLLAWLVSFGRLSMIPTVLLDGLCRFAMIRRDDDGSLPVYVPVSCRRLLVRPGKNDAQLIKDRRNITLKAETPRLDGDIIRNKRAEAAEPDGALLLVVEDLVARPMGVVPDV